MPTLCIEEETVRVGNRAARWLYGATIAFSIPFFVTVTTSDTPRFKLVQPDGSSITVGPLNHLALPCNALALVLALVALAYGRRAGSRKLVRTCTVLSALALIGIVISLL